MGNVSHMNLKTLEARRYQKTDARPTQVRIDNTLSVTSLEVASGDTARIEFTYTASYGAFGVIKIDGEFQYKDAAMPGAAAMWKEKRQMPGEVASQLHTTIMQACVPEAVLLARSIQLPPPIPIPQIQFQKKDASPGRIDADPNIA